MSGVPVLLAGILAANPQGPNTAKVSPGLAGFITVFLLALAVVVLVRSMVKHLRKVRYSLDPDGNPWTPPGTAAPRSAPAVPSATGEPDAEAGPQDPQAR